MKLQRQKMAGKSAGKTTPRFVPAFPVRLLHVRDLHDAALALRVVDIFDHGDIERLPRTASRRTRLAVERQTARRGFSPSSKATLVGPLPAATSSDRRSDGVRRLSSFGVFWIVRGRVN
jgi:hypothetical protein